MAREPRGITPDTQLRIAEGLDVVLLSQDEVLIQYGSRSYPSELLRDTDLSGFLGRIVWRLLREPATVDALLIEAGEAQRATAYELISDLLQRGVLAEVSRSPVQQYLRYTFDGQADLADRSVTLIGAGPVGARLAQGLLQHGLGRLTLLDDRSVDHLWQELLPLGPDIAGLVGQPAHQALRERLVTAGFAGVDAIDGPLDPEHIEDAVRRADFVAVAREQPALHLSHLVNRFCIRDRKPWMLATIDGNVGLVGPLFVPVNTACFNDYWTLAEAATPSPEMARQHRLRRGASSFFPGLPAYAEIVAGHATLAIVHFLLRDASFALGRVLSIEFDRLLIDVEDVLKLPRCPVCGTEKSAYRPPFPADLVSGESGH